MHKLLWSAFLSLLGVATILITACSGGGSQSNSVAISVTITNPATPPIITQGQSVSITAAVANDPANRGATWSLSGQGKLSNQTATTVTYNAPANVTTSFMATVTATSVSDTTKSAALVITIGMPTISVTITNPLSPPTIAQGQTVNVTAAVRNDPANKGVTWSLSGQGTLSNQTATTVTYNPPATVATSFKATVTATSVSDATKSAALVIAVQSPGVNDSEATGQYAFLVNGFDDATGNQFAYIGSLTMNGSGEITAGIEDVNLPSGMQTSIPIQGTYAIGADNRGTATITGGGVSNTFAFSVGSITGGVASQLNIIEFDDTNGTSGRRGSGTAYLQVPAAFSVASINGPYAIELIGQNATAGSRAVILGAFTATGTTGDIAGTVDLNNAGTVAINNPFTGTITSSPGTATSGQVTLTILGSNQVGYIVSASQILVMSTTDITTTGLASGQILQQSTASFTENSLNGAAIQYDTGVGSVAGKGYAEAGPITFNSSTSQGTFDFDTDDSGTSGTLSGTFTYSVSANGHVTLTGTPPFLPDLWLIDINKAFVMGTGASVNTGFFEPQSAGPFSVASISGNYAVGMAQAQPVTGGNVTSGVASSSGNGTLSAILDISMPSGQLQSAQAQSLTLTITSANVGRFTDSDNGIGFIISPTEFVRIDSTAAAPQVLVFAK
jgi:hypothetical protein